VANHKDALKRIRQNAKRRTRNRHYRTMMRTQIKHLRVAIESGDNNAAEAQLPKAVSMIQRVGAKGIIHRRQVARRVSRLTHAVKAMSAGPAES
jgi:small subunit ribosomal protein S20